MDQSPVTRVSEAMPDQPQKRRSKGPNRRSLVATEKALDSLRERMARLLDDGITVTVDEGSEATEATEVTEAIEATDASSDD